MALNRKLDASHTRDTGHGYMRVLPIITIVALIALAIVAALISYITRGFRGMPTPDFPRPTATLTLPTFDGGVLAPLLGIVVLLLAGIFLLLLLLFICNCLCKSAHAPGLPLPGLPDLGAVAATLRAMATSLRTLADQIETANVSVDAARDKLKAMTSFTIVVPKFKKIGDVWVPDGIEEKSIFDADTESKINTFIDDATGETTLHNAAADLRGKAALLDEQATTLGG